MIPFLKMNGLGNDFAVIDVRDGTALPAPDDIRALADRSAGIGFDQFIAIAPPPADAVADATMRIVNADGGEVESCGNAARCVARLLLGESAGAEVRIASAGGMMTGWAEGEDIAVDMGVPRYGAAEIPLADRSADPLHLTVPGYEALGPAACVNVGNPHAVFFVEDAAAVALHERGPALERHPMFPERANITFAQVGAPDRVVARVWERGVGATRACGTAACATLAVGHRRGLLGAEARVILPGGPLIIALRDGRIVMRGPTELEWQGTITGATFTRA